MKKNHTYNELSNVKCACGKRIKQRIVEQKQSDKALKCYNCWIDDQAQRSGKSVTFINKAASEIRHAEETRI